MTIFSDNGSGFAQGVIIVYQLERTRDQGTSNSFVLTLLLHNFE